MRAEALIHSISDQLITNVHAIEQAVSNHRWMELGRLYVENAELGLKLVTCLIQLDEDSAEFAIKELRKLYAVMPAKTGPVVGAVGEAAPAGGGGAVGIVAPGSLKPKEPINGNASTGNAKHPGGTGKGPDGKNGGGTTGGVSNSD